MKTTNKGGTAQTKKHSGMEKIITAIALYEMVIGLLGTYYAIASISGSGPLLPPMLFSFLSAFSVLSIISGVFLLQRSKLGYILSLLLQGMQIISFVTASLAYYFINGPSLFITIIYNAAHLFFNLSLTAPEFDFFLIANPKAAATHISINLIALTLFSFLVNRYKKNNPQFKSKRIP